MKVAGGAKWMVEMSSLNHNKKCIVRIFKISKIFVFFQVIWIADFSPLFGWLATFTKGKPLANVAAQLKCSKIVSFIF